MLTVKCLAVYLDGIAALGEDCFDFFEFVRVSCDEGWVAISFQEYGSRCVNTN